MKRFDFLVASEKPGLKGWPNALMFLCFISKELGTQGVLGELLLSVMEIVIFYII